MFRCATLLALTVVAWLSPARGWAQDAVVLASTVPGYVPGMVVSANDRLNVPEGASATLLFQSGDILRLGGPFEGVLGQQNAASQQNGVAALAELFRTRGIDATVIGGTRSISPTRSVVMIDDVQVDARRSGTYCFQPSSSVWITRPVGDERAYAVRRKGSSRILGWPAGAERVEWPSDVPIDDGSQFEIVTNGAAHATITFRALSGAGLTSLVSGILMGCHDQFDAELHRVTQSVIRPELWMTTDRGRHPVYAPGEPITLTVMSNIDGYLYCAAGAADRGAVPIFPAGAIDGAQMRGSVALSIPGRRDPVALKAGPDVQWIRCWLADRDIASELPHALLNASGRRIPDQLADDLDSIFARVRSTRIQAEALAIAVK
ncbi:MAG TPA: DUF4384 domain-containing protein [Rhodopila sp.]|nr:DUF4384 domain-containing protein [Rhodopila sp.]